jgi:hypothetical protein
MRKRFDIFLRNAADGLVKFHAHTLQTEAKANEVMLETDTYLGAALGRTFLGLRDGLKGRELWEMEFQAYQDKRTPYTYLGAFTSKLRDVADDWVED